MKGLGTDEKAIIDILCFRPLQQRLEIKAAYLSQYGKDLIADLTSELSGKFENVIEALLLEPVQYDAKCLHDAMKGLGTNEHMLTQIICTLSNDEVLYLRQVFQKEYGKDLVKEVINETSGEYQKVLVACLEGRRQGYSYDQQKDWYTKGPSEHVDQAGAQMAAKELLNAGIGTKGTDESAFIRIICTSGPSQLRAIVEDYTKIAKEDLFKSIDKEMSGDLAKSLKAVILSQINKPAYFAQLLHDAMKGLGTKDTTLIRVIVTRAEVDLQEIKREFQLETGKSLRSFIEGDISGDYKVAILALVGQ